MMASGEEEEVASIISNKQVVLRDHHVTGYLKESDMCMSISTITLKVPHNSKGFWSKTSTCLVIPTFVAIPKASRVVMLINISRLAL